MFPVNRWIKANSSLKLTEYDSVLPQDDVNTEQREAELRAKREMYMLSGKILGAPPQVGGDSDSFFVLIKKQYLVIR